MANGEETTPNLRLRQRQHATTMVLTCKKTAVNLCGNQGELGILSLQKCQVTALAARKHAPPALPLRKLHL